MYEGLMWYFLHFNGPTYVGGLFTILDDCYSKKVAFYATSETIVEYVPCLAKLRFLYKDSNNIRCILQALFDTLAVEGIFTFRYHIQDGVLYRSDDEEYRLEDGKFYTFFNVHSLTRMNAEQFYRVPSSLTFDELAGIC